MTVGCEYSASLSAADDTLVSRVPWKVLRVPRPASERYVAATSRTVARAFDRLGATVPMSIAASAYDGPAAALRSAAVEVAADLYIAHYVVALPAAAEAARRHRGMLAFDAEDFHSGEGGDGEAEAFRMRLVRRIEGAILPRCSYSTAASPLIGMAYEKAYGIKPVTMLNVFPLSMAPDRPSHRAAGELRAYWFSQTVGLDRGLQAFMEGITKAQAKVTLDIRGNDPWRHGESLLALARDLGVADRVRLLPVAAPDEMARLAASYDLGLSLETEATDSRRFCLTNKIFTYLLAGIPVMMSNTPAQTALATELDSAAAMVSLSKPATIGEALDRLADEQVLAKAKADAWRLARERYNWDKEKSVLLEVVASVFRNRGKEAHR
ncbi:MAG TPA: hypothetical protein VFB13_09280 [Reyranella sp.]|nr:hypothetical protein [Reyranella sp.]